MRNCGLKFRAIRYYSLQMFYCETHSTLLTNIAALRNILLLIVKHIWCKNDTSYVQTIPHAANCCSSGHLWLIGLVFSH